MATITPWPLGDFGAPCAVNTINGTTSADVTNSITVLSKTRYIAVEVIGGGGGGGSSFSTAANTASAGGGGQAGAYCRAYMLASNLTGPLVCTAGRSGVGGALGALNRGTDGNASTITMGGVTLVSAAGGLGSFVPAPATTGVQFSAGGGGTSQPLPTVAEPMKVLCAFRGQNGQDGYAIGGTVNNVAVAGDGGQSYMGWGGRGGSVTNAARDGGSPNRDPINGGGGGGAGASGNFTAKGGDGAPGIIIVYQFE